MQENCVDMLPNQLGKTYILRLCAVYSKLWEEHYGIKPIVSFGLMGKIFKELKEYFNEYQIAYFLILFFNWSGANGDDDFLRKRLESKTHSIYMLKAEIDSMRAYSKNCLGIDTDDLNEIKKRVDKILN